jgi:hypothetical protein
MSPRAFGIVVAFFAALLITWIVTSTEWGEVEIPAPLRGEAATNPFYAAQRLVEALGGTSERREALGSLGTDAVVVLSAWSWDIDAARRAEIERWVEAGGRLVVDAGLLTGSDAFERWSGIERQRAPEPEDADVFEAEEIPDRCRAMEESGDEINGPEPSVYTVCEFDHSSWLETATHVRWGLVDGDLMTAARVTVRQGTVTVLNGVPFVYRELFEGEHGELLAAALNLRVGDHVVFMSEADVASLPELVWRHGAPFVVVLLLWIALALWRGATRFGPLMAPSEPARRSLAEQVLGTGRFAVRVGGGTPRAARGRGAAHRRLRASGRRRAGRSRRSARRHRRARARRRPRCRPSLASARAAHPAFVARNRASSTHFKEPLAEAWKTNLISRDAGPCCSSS